jgi:hypothetical protein
MRKGEIEMKVKSTDELVNGKCECGAPVEDGYWEHGRGFRKAGFVPQQRSYAARCTRCGQVYSAHVATWANEATHLD